MTSADQPDRVLAGFRKSIDNIDAALIHMLAERFRITQAVGAYKAKAALPPADPGREHAQIVLQALHVLDGLECGLAVVGHIQRRIVSADGRGLRGSGGHRPGDQPVCPPDQEAR
ncbi:MAG: chorismate mutase [Proteobacteria bacterium]|nr:chorismate mutase [Pseudomonadota bacterium]